jgi:Uncharacterized conserved protein
MITVSEVAAEKFKEAIEKRENPQNVMLRVAFLGFG